MPVNVNPIMAAIVEAADTLNTAPEDYINPDDGLKYCGKCHTPKEAYFPEQYRKNGLDKHPIACKCAAEERARREAEQRELERLNRIAMLRSEAFRDIPAAGWRFENAEVMTPQLVKARRYSENWDAFRQDGTGLLLFVGLYNTSATVKIKRVTQKEFPAKMVVATQTRRRETLMSHYQHLTISEGRFTIQVQQKKGRFTIQVQQ